MTPPPNLQELIDSVVADAGGGADDLALLSTAAGTAARLEEAADAVLGHFVDRCRQEGRTWTEISAALGVTKQAAHKRFSFSTAGLERWTPRAKAVVEAAPVEAQSLGHNYIGTEHLLAAIFSDPGSMAAAILSGAGVDKERLLRALMAHVPAFAGIPADPPETMTPRATQALADSLSQAVALGHNYIGTEHVLLGILANPASLGARVLGELGLTAAGVRAEVEKRLAPYGGTAAQGSPAGGSPAVE